MLETASTNRLQLSREDATPPLIQAEGELSYENCGQLERLIHDTVASRGPNLALRLGELDFVDSSGLRVLAKAAYDAVQSGGSITVLSLSQHLSRSLDITGFGQLFDRTSCIVAAPGMPSVRLGTLSATSFDIPVGADASHDARARISDFAECAGFHRTELDDIRHAVGEAIANAVRHGNCGDKPIQVQCSSDNARLRVEMRYPSDPFDPDAVPPPDFDSEPEGGMGIYFMRLLMDLVKYDFADGCAVLVMEKRPADR